MRESLENILRPVECPQSAEGTSNSQNADESANLGSDVLYVNQGEGTFRDETAGRGLSRTQP